jgi:hypothetical protein
MEVFGTRAANKAARRVIMKRWVEAFARARRSYLASRPVSTIAVFVAVTLVGGLNIASAPLAGFPSFGF